MYQAQSLRIGIQADVLMSCRKLGNQLGRAVGGLAVDDEDFEPLRVVVLRNQLGEGAIKYFFATGTKSWRNFRHGSSVDCGSVVPGGRRQESWIL